MRQIRVNGLRGRALSHSERLRRQSIAKQVGMNWVEALSS